MSGQCYACTDPGSIAPLHILFGQPMHTTCFLNFIAWDANRRAIQMKKPRWKLKRVDDPVRRMKAMVPGATAPLHILLGQAKHANCVLKFAAWHANRRAILRMPTAWALCNHRSHTTPNSDNLKRLEDSVRRIVALGYVFKFQEKIREMWKTDQKKTLQKKILYRKIAALWRKKHPMTQETHDSSSPPSLQGSSSENDDNVPPAMSDSSSDSDTPIFQNPRFYHGAPRRL